MAKGKYVFCIFKCIKSTNWIGVGDHLDLAFRSTPSLIFRCQPIKIILRWRDQPPPPPSPTPTQCPPSSVGLAFLLSSVRGTLFASGLGKGHVTEGASEASSFRRPPLRPWGCRAPRLGPPHTKRASVPCRPLQNRERSTSKGFPAAVSPRHPGIG